MLVALSSWALLFTHVDRTPFHGDESGWISTGVYYTELLARRDFDRDRWNCHECAQWGSLNMQLGKLLVGLPNVLTPPAQEQRFFRFYDFEISPQENLRQNRIPPPDVLRRARLASVTFGALCCVLIFAVGYFAFDVYVGLLASALLLTHASFIEHATRAMTDVHLHAFLLGLCLALVLLVRLGLRQHPWRWGCLCGLLAGLASSVKITGLAIGACLVSAVLIRGIVGGFVRRGDATRVLTAFGLSSVLVVYGLNPSFWPTARVFDAGDLLRELGALSRAAAGGEVNAFMDSNAHPQLSNIGVIRNFPQLFIGWSRFMEAQAQRLPDAQNWRGNRLATLHFALFRE